MASSSMVWSGAGTFHQRSSLLISQERQQRQSLLLSEGAAELPQCLNGIIQVICGVLDTVFGRYRRLPVELVGAAAGPYGAAAEMEFRVDPCGAVFIFFV